MRIARTAGSDEGYSLVGCLLPYGRLRRLASENESDDVNTELVQIGPAHGTWVEITAGEDNQYGSTTAVVLRNVATGEGYEVNTERSTIGEYPADILSRLIFDSHGHAITALIPQGSMPPDPAKDTEAISVYTGDGTQIVLDSGPRPDVPPESLSLNGGVAAWTHSGVRRSVMFAG